MALVVKNPPVTVGDIRDAGSVLGLGRAPGEGNGNPWQYSCLENPMDRAAWKTIVHRSQRVWHDWECTHVCIFMGCLISALAEACGVNDFVIYWPVQELSENERQPYLTESRAAGIHSDCWATVEVLVFLFRSLNWKLCHNLRKSSSVPPGKNE